MTEKELKKLSRKDLLEMLIAQSRKNKQLQQSLELTEKELRQKEIRINQAGSIAEAALQLSGIFQAADSAAQQYLEGVKHYGLRKKEEADQLLRETEKKAAAILSNAQSQSIHQETLEGLE